MRKNETSRFQTRRVISLLLLTALLLPFGALRPVQAGNKGELPVHPALLQAALDYPDALYQVIVQKVSKEKNPEADVEAGGGKIKKKLDLIASFAAEMSGAEVLKLARHKDVRWISIDAPTVVAGGFDSNTYQDDFNAVSFSGSNGTLSWMADPWTEVGESDGATNGKVWVAQNIYCAGENCLRIGGSNVSISGKGASRKVNLSQVTSATLKFSSRVQANSFNLGVVFLQISENDGVSWVTLDIFSLASTDSSQIAESYDISAFSSASTMVRFIGMGSVNGYLNIDDVQIEFSRLANSYNRSIMANIVWQNNPTPGEGITVAVVDGGISNHPDLSNPSSTRIVASVEFTRDSYFPNSEGGGADDYGHGTHVAGIIGGMGQSSQGARLGNAPFVNLVNVKVTGADGSGYLSDLIDGLQWIYENRAAYNIRVVNISINSAVAESYHTSPVDAAVEILWFNGIVVVVSAGNNGSGGGPVALLPPANDPFVITVGAADEMGTPWLGDDVIPTFSAYGTTENSFAKPDLVAPGRNIISLLAGTNSTVYLEHEANRVDDHYFRMSGTSMAAPMVTGAAALILQRSPSLNPDQVKYRLMSTANTNWPAYDPAKAGAGYLNAFASAMSDSSQSANAGIQPSQMLSSGSEPITWGSVGWNSVGWNSVGWNSVGWNSVGWNSVGWNSVGWNSSVWDN